MLHSTLQTVTCSLAMTALLVFAGPGRAQHNNQSHSGHGSRPAPAHVSPAPVHRASPPHGPVHVSPSGPVPSRVPVSAAGGLSVVPGASARVTNPALHYRYNPWRTNYLAASPGYSWWWYPGYQYGYWPGYGYDQYAYPGYDAGWYDEPGVYGGLGEPALTPEAPEATTANVEVLLPDPEALVWFNDRKTSSTGDVRSFTTPPLDPGRQYYYDVRAAWRENGRLVTTSRQAVVRAGADVVVDFTRAAAQPARPR